MKRFLLLGITFIFFGLSYSQSEIKTDTIYSDNGKVIGYGKIKDGKRVGRWHFYGQGENVFLDLTYLEDSMVYVRHYSDNKLRRIFYGKFKNDTIIGSIDGGVCYEFYNGEYLAAMYYLSNDKINGDYFEYYPSQAIKSQRHFTDNAAQGKAVNYYEDGMIESEGNLVDGIKSGKWKSYHPNGVLKSEGNYTVVVVGLDAMGLKEISSEFYDSWVTVDSLLVKDGIWRYYSEKGELIQEEKYEKGSIR